MGNDPCLICGTIARTHANIGQDAIQQTCPQCGTFIISGSVVSMLGRSSGLQKALLSGWAREQSDRGETARVTTHNLPRIINRAQPSVHQRADALLLFIAKQSPKLGTRVTWDEVPPAAVALTYSQDASEVCYLLNLLENIGLLAREKYIDSVGESTVTPTGYERIYELQLVRTDNTQAFVAMWFGGTDRRTEMDQIYDTGLAEGIRRAGYNPHRVDKGQYNGKIDDEIIRQIRQSRFVVADYTNHINGVYYEAGYGEGYGLPIIQTCQANEISKLHFDNRQINTIAWETAGELADRLHKRIEGTIGRGPLGPIPN